MKRKMLVAMLGVCLMLSGCGGGKDAGPAGGTSTEPEEVVAEEPEETVPEDPEEEVPPKTYVEENGLEFSQDTAYTLQAVRYNGEDDMFYDFIDERLVLESIQIEPSETEGYQTVTIESSASGEIWSNVAEYKDHLNLKRFVLCEMYTGRIVPSAPTDNDMQIEYGMEVEWEGETYQISYTENTEWEWGDWFDVEPGIGNMTGTIHVTCIVTVPEGYDGLLLWASPHREWDGKSSDAGVVDETEQYIMDEWEEGDYLLRVGDLYEILNASE